MTTLHSIVLFMQPIPYVWIFDGFSSFKIVLKYIILGMKKKKMSLSLRGRFAKMG